MLGLEHHAYTGVPPNEDPSDEHAQSFGVDCRTCQFRSSSSWQSLTGANLSLSPNPGRVVPARRSEPRSGPESAREVWVRPRSSVATSRTGGETNTLPSSRALFSRSPRRAPCTPTPWATRKGTPSRWGSTSLLTARSRRPDARPSLSKPVQPSKPSVRPTSHRSID